MKSAILPTEKIQAEAGWFRILCPIGPPLHHTGLSLAQLSTTTNNSSGETYASLSKTS